MARITAERLIQHLARAGFVLMRSEPNPALTMVIMTMLIAGAFDCVNAAVILQNYDPAAVCPVPCFCHGLVVGIAVDLSRAGNSSVLVEKNEAVKRYSLPPWPCVA